MINKENLRKLINNEFGTLEKAAKEIGISKSGLSRMLSGNRDIGIKSLKALKSFCNKRTLNIDDYIFLG